jgi:hypothetical protein
MSQTKSGTVLPPRAIVIGAATLFVAIMLFACWLGYEVNWIRQRHALLDEQNVTASFDPLRRAPSVGLWLLGERGADTVFLQYSGWLGMELDEVQRDRARRLFPEADIRPWGGTIPFHDDPGKPRL